MHEVDRLAEFVVSRDYTDLSAAAVEQLKLRVLDSLGCAFGALAAEPVVAVRKLVSEFGGTPLCSMIDNARTAPDRAAFWNGALVRYLDFMDSYLAVGETNHPSDNLGAVLAAAEYDDASGREFLTALAVAYQVHTRLSDVAPVRHKGFDHTTQGAYAVAAGVAKALQLDRTRTAHAIAIAGTANNALRVTRTGSLSHWKGLAYPNTAFSATHAAFLARNGITGPAEVFEGTKGFKDAIAGPFTIDWAAEDLERVRETLIKKYNAEVHAQPALEGALELRSDRGFDAAAIDRIEIDIFDVAHRIIGGGEEGAKTEIRTKEEADHSLPYMIAAALIDGRLLPDQYTPERIARADVQALLRRVQVRPDPQLSERFPSEMPVRVAILLKDGSRHECWKRDYRGFPTNPMDWDEVAEKFDTLSRPAVPEARLAPIREAVRQLETMPVRKFAALLRDPDLGG